MADLLEMHQLDRLAIGAVGRPGERVFMLEARSPQHAVWIVLEKEQVAVFALEASEFLDKLGEEYPEEHELIDPVESVVKEPESPPLFRARVIGLNFLPDDDVVLVELREAEPVDEDEEDDDEDDEGVTGWVARMFATRAQVRAIVAAGAEAVQAGRVRWN